MGWKMNDDDDDNDDILMYDCRLIKRQMLWGPALKLQRDMNKVLNIIYTLLFLHPKADYVRQFKGLYNRERYKDALFFFIALENQQYIYFYI